VDTSLLSESSAIANPSAGTGGPVTLPTSTSEKLDLDLLRNRIDRRLSEFLREKRENAASAETAALIDLLTKFHGRGGKRLRPLLCLCGWHMKEHGRQADDVAIDVASSLELFHMFALIHDDIMDRSDVRRGHPSMHRELQATWHGHGVGEEKPEWFGISAAILLGDLALILSQEILTTSPMSSWQRDAVYSVIDAMRAEVLAGQYHDLLAEQNLCADVSAALRVIRYKTAKYTFERPLQLGATLAGADADLLEACSSYALPIGEAFQLRDDVLGVFGDPEVTGKSVVDDLRCGKQTMLVAVALQRGDPAAVALLESLVGKPDLDAEGIEVLRHLLVSTEALRIVAEMIDNRVVEANRVLEHAPFPHDVRDVLAGIAHSMTTRTH
jgi:geranylgeranyl diphosphate synthase type I